MLLNFGDRTRTGVFNMVWSLTRDVIAKLLLKDEHCAIEAAKSFDVFNLTTIIKCHKDAGYNKRFIKISNDISQNVTAFVPPCRNVSEYLRPSLALFLMT